MPVSAYDPGKHVAHYRSLTPNQAKTINYNHIQDNMNDLPAIVYIEIGQLQSPVIPVSPA